MGLSARHSVLACALPLPVVGLFQNNYCRRWFELYRHIMCYLSYHAPGGTTQEVHTIAMCEAQTSWYFGCAATQEADVFIE